MSNADFDPFTVTASLQGAPGGRLRIRYDYPAGGFTEGQLRRLLEQRLPGAEFAQRLTTPIDSVVEIDREHLRKLRFSRQELAEIGFALARQLWVVERWRSSLEND